MTARRPDLVRHETGPDHHLDHRLGEGQPTTPTNKVYPVLLDFTRDKSGQVGEFRLCSIFFPNLLSVCVHAMHVTSELVRVKLYVFYDPSPKLCTQIGAKSTHQVYP